jgi:hypothetical protein
MHSENRGNFAGTGAMKPAPEQHANYHETGKVIFLDHLIAAAGRVMPQNERRSDERRPCQASIAFKARRTGQRQHGRMYNISRRGMYFESDSFLRPGTVLKISSEVSAGPHLDQLLAEVVWCDEILDAVVIHNYATGVRFTRPIRHFRSRQRFRVIDGGAENSQT